MKKVCYVLLLLLLLTGCSRLGTDIEENIDVLLADESDLSNVYFEGYSYYVPNGLMFLAKNDYNSKFRDSYNNEYYMYVDVISYYNKTKDKYKMDKSLYLSRLLNYDDKTGILNIEEVDGGYFVELFYNYSKVEVYSKKNTLNDVIINALYLLKTVDYNDKVLDSLVGDNILNYQGESYNIFDNNIDKDNFIDYVEEYDTYEDVDGILPDSDNVDIEEDN